MRCPIHQKINRQLEARGSRKKDLAAKLGISPQTMTDICKGRSAITLRHLRKLVEFFGIRASYWLDERRAEPRPLEDLELFGDDELVQLEQVLLRNGSDRREAARLLAMAVETRRHAWRQSGVASPDAFLELLEDATRVPPSDDAFPFLRLHAQEAEA